MIHKLSQEQLAERFNQIPVELRKAIASNANADNLFEIGKRHGLLIDKTGELAAETGLFMLGVTHPDEFAGNLAERLQVDRETASKIADDINREIFAPVREHLRGMFGPSMDSTSSPQAGSGQGGTPQKEISEERSPKNMEHETWSMEQQKTKGPAKTQQTTTTLEDLETELEQALAQEKGIQALSVVKKPVPVPQSQTQPTYKGADPYREQVGEGLPNVQGKAYAPQSMEHGAWNMEQKKNAIPNPASRFQPPASRIQPTPTPKPVEENSPFTPLGAQKPAPATPRSKEAAAPKADPYHEPAKPTGVLSPFRGFKMNNETAQPEKKEGDQNKESVM